MFSTRLTKFPLFIGRSMNAWSYVRLLLLSTKFHERNKSAAKVCPSLSWENDNETDIYGF